MNGSVGFHCLPGFHKPNVFKYKQLYIFFNRPIKLMTTSIEGKIQHLYLIKFCDNRIIIQQNFLL